MNVESKDTHFKIALPNNVHVFHYVWLRDNCGCDKCTHPSSLQKLRSSATISLDVKPSFFVVNSDGGDNSLVVKWSDGHESEYSEKWLENNYYSENSISERRQKIKPILWGSADIGDKHYVNYSAFVQDDKILVRSLQIFLDYGILFITDVPSETESVEKVATRIGPIRETFFGRTWDVVNIPNAHNIAYTSVELGLHQDLPYFESVPPVQLLHCLQQATTGGENVFIDAYLAAERLKQEKPHYFETLLRVYSSDLVFKKKLKVGELVIFDNRRVLHGRASFNPNEPRHLRGTYLGMDEVEDRYNTLKEKIK